MTPQASVGAHVVLHRKAISVTLFHKTCHVKGALHSFIPVLYLIKLQPSWMSAGFLLLSSTADANTKV